MRVAAKLLDISNNTSYCNREEVPSVSVSTRSSESDGRSDVTDKFRFFVCNEMVRFFCV